MKSRGDALGQDTGVITAGGTVSAQRQVGSVSTAVSGLDMDVRFAPALTVIRLRGELDAANVRVLDDAMCAVILPRAKGAVIVDAAGLTVCDEAGTAAIDAACARIAELGLPVSRRGR